MIKKTNKESEIKEYLILWFQNKTKMKIKKNYLDKDYFHEEWIDSFEIVNLIEELQDQFNIEFNDTDFQHSNFSTINGLTKIIIKK